MEPDEHPDASPEAMGAPTESEARAQGVTLWSTAEGPAPQTDVALELVGDRYEILAMLGEGGMGTVYKVRDRELDEIVALKMLRADFAHQPRLLQRFRREVKLARRVTHPNVARTYDIGEHGPDRFLTMEHVEGKSLGDLRREEPIPLTEVLRIVGEVGAGLAAAHEQGIVHRDLKPDNVLLGQGGRVVISDFGIARLAESEDEAVNLTMGGMIGTPEYMAPEQLDGRSDVDGRADLYALGIILYELVVGTRPWKGSSPFAVLQARARQPKPDLRAARPDLPEELLALVDRCLEEDRDRRFGTIGEFLEALGRVCPVASARCQPGPDPRERPSTTLTGVRTVAVLPFTNGGPPADTYLASGLAEDLIDVLSVTPGLRVRPLGAVEPVAGLDPREAGRRLEVQVVVSGSIRRVGSSFRLSTRLVSVEDGFQLWAGRFTCTTDDLLAVSEEAAAAVADALTVEGAEPVAVARDGQAVDLYLRARYSMHRSWYTSMAEAIACFEEALERQPEDPRILAGAATAHARQAFLESENDRQHVRKALDLASRAIRFAPDRGEPYQALAMARLNNSDVAGAFRALVQAVERMPSLPEAHHLLGQILLEIEGPEEALRSIDRALALDPNLYFCRLERIRAHALLGRWEEVDSAFAAPIEGDEHRLLHQILRDRLAMWRGLGPAGADEPALDIEAGRASGMARLMRAVRDSGQLSEGQRTEVLRRAEAAGEGSRFRRIMLQTLAEMAFHVGDVEGGLEYLDQVVEAGLIDRVWLAHCPLFDAVRGDARFARLVDEVEARVAVLLSETRAATP